MGLELKKEILAEQDGLAKYLIDQGKKIFKTIKASGRPFSNPTKAVINDFFEIPYPTYKKILSVLKNEYSDLTMLSRIESFTLGRIVAQDTPTVETLYQKQFRKAMTELGVSEKELLEKIQQDSIDNFGGDLKKTLLSIFKNEGGQIDQSSEMLTGILYDKVSSRLKALSGKFKPEIFPVEGTFKNWIKNMEPSIMKAFREIQGTWINPKKDKEWIDDKLKEIESKIQEKTSRTIGMGSPDPQTAVREMRELLNFLMARRLSAGDDAKELIKLHIDDNPRIPKNLKDELKKFGYYDEILKRLDADVTRVTAKQMWESLVKNTQALPIIGGPLKSIIKSWFIKDYKLFQNLGKDFAEGMGRFFLTVIYRSPYTPSEIIARSIALGRTATIVEKILAYIFWHNTVIPLALQLVEGAVTNTEIQRLKFIVETVREACLSGVLEPCPTEDLDQLENYTREQFWKGFKEKMPIGDAFEAIKDPNLKNILSSFTGIDEFYNFGANVVTNFIFGDQTIFQTYMSQLTEANKSIENSLRSLGVDPKNKEDIMKLKGLLNKRYKNTLTEFVTSFRDTGMKINDQECEDLGGGKYSYDGSTYTFKVTNPTTGEGVFKMDVE